MRVILFALVAVFFTGMIYLILMSRAQARRKSGETAKKAEPNPKEEIKKATLRRIQGAIQLCIAVKLQAEEEVLSKLLNLTESLKELLPLCNEKYPEKETTWKINRMADGHLPKIIQPYVALGKDQRDQRRGELVELLHKMKKDVDDVRDLLSQDNEMAYDSKARFLENTYNKI